MFIGIHDENYINALKGRALKDFFDREHPGMSLIEIYVTDRTGYKELAEKGKIPKQLFYFISKRAGDIENASKISSPWKRNKKYDEIFDDYFSIQKLKADMLSKESSSDETREMATLACPIHKTELKKLGVRQCYNEKTNKRVVLPMYLCEQCDKLYTYTADGMEGKIWRFNGVKYKNLYGNPSVKITMLQEGTKCIVYSERKPTICKRYDCNNEKLVSSDLFRLNEKKELKSLDGEKCPLCGTYYVSYPVYLKNKDMLQCMYANNEAAVKIEYENLQKMRKLEEEKKRLALEKRKEERQKRKALEKQLSARQHEKFEDELFDHDNVVRIEDFMIWGDIFHCKRDRHIIKDINAKISIIGMDGEVFERTIPAGYCRNCNIFFIMRSSYQNLKKWGTPICRVCDEKAYYEGEGGNWGGLNPESKLKQYGYSVSQTDGLTATRRRKILTLLIDKEIMERIEIISYLDLFIRINSSQAKKAIAISKWEDDRDFIEKYNKGFYTKYGVGGLHRR